jgi:hypothetical protein
MCRLNCDCADGLRYGRYWPEASVRCLAAIRPESGVKPTCRDSWTDAFDPKRKCPLFSIRANRNNNRMTSFGCSCCTQCSAPSTRIGAAPLGAGAGFHSLKRAGRLIDAPIALARNETGRHIDRAARKRFKLGSVFAATKSASIPL